MLPRILRIVFAGVLVLGSGAALAQSAQPDPRLPQVRAAIQAAELGQFTVAQYGSLSGHPLYGWIEYAALRRDIDTLPDAQGQAFLARYKGQAVASAFRELWLAALSRREDWRAFRAAWSPEVQGTALRCSELNARQATGDTDAQWTSDAQALWRELGSKPAPKECAAPFTVLAAKGGLPPALRWDRFDQATDDCHFPERGLQEVRALDPLDEFAFEDVGRE